MNIGTYDGKNICESSPIIKDMCANCIESYPISAMNLEKPINKYTYKHVNMDEYIHINDDDDAVFDIEYYTEPVSEINIVFMVRVRSCVNITI